MAHFRGDTWQLCFQMHGDKPARMVLVEETGVWEEPLAKERAEAMGFS